MIDGIAETRNKLSDATLSVGWGYAQANMNRRAVDVNGKASLGMNPDKPVDRRIGLLRPIKPDGTDGALIANCAMHGTVMSGANLKISGDCRGSWRNMWKKRLVRPCYISMALPEIWRRSIVFILIMRAGHLGEFRVLVGDKIIAAPKNENAGEQYQTVHG
ncbi:MAG: hypothetical protein M9933_15375 [Chitinophagaceae bacterium]|nr:hypothetical protein [Chitinophagaceae bacterium]